MLAVEREGISCSDCEARGLTCWQDNLQGYNPSFTRKLKTQYPDAVTPRDKQQAYPFELLWQEGCEVLGIRRDRNQESKPKAAVVQSKDDHFRQEKTIRARRERDEGLQLVSLHLL